jgi:hypothetical protein
LYFTNNNLSFVFASIDTVEATPDTLHRIDLNFVGANDNAKTFPMQKQPDYLNYFLAQCPYGITNLHGNQRLLVSNLYDGIDLMYTSNNAGLKYYFIFKSGADLQKLLLNFTGASSIHLDSTTNKLTINSSIGSISFNQPTAYQLDASNNIVTLPWQCRWIKGDSTNYYFYTDDIDANKALIIEVDRGRSPLSPTSNNNLDWCTYFSAGADAFSDVKTDASGNVYLTGYCSSNLFPVYNGSSIQSSYSDLGDIAIVKLRPTNNREWAAFVGGMGNDYGISVGTDAYNNVYSVAQVGSNFPCKNPGGGAYYDSIFNGGIDIGIVKISANGTQKIWATYYGANSNEYAESIVFDQYENIYIVGYQDTYDSLPLYNQPGTINNITGQALILKFNLYGVPKWITRFGGTASTSAIYGAATDASGNLFVGGVINNGSGFPILNNGANATYGGGTYDGFLTKFGSHATNNNLLMSTYLGGSAYDAVKDVKCDANGDVFVIGTTNSDSLSFPLLNPSGTSDYFQGTFGGGNNDVFISKFNSIGNLRWSTYFGKLGNERAGKLAVDNIGNIYILGVDNSNDLPLPNPNLNNGYFEQYKGYTDAFITAFNTSLKNIWGTYFGGNGLDVGQGIATFANSRLYATGYTTNDSTSFPIINKSGAYNQEIYSGTLGFTWNAFIAGFDLAPVIALSVEDKFDSNIDFKIFPNPTDNSFTISINLTKRSNIKIDIINILGQKVISENMLDKIGNSDKKISVIDLASGIYIINVTIDDKVSSIKLIKN